MKADPDKTKPITDMPTPSNASELRRFLGMVQYITKFIPDIASKIQPLRELLNKESQWTWGAPQSRPIKLIKDIITSEPSLSESSRNKVHQVMD